MTNTSKTVVFFGNERLVSGLASTDAPLLRGLIAAGYHIAAVVSHHSESSSRNQRPLEVAEIAAEHNIPVLLPNKPLEILEQLAAYNADAAILSAYGRIIPQSIIDIFPFGIINVHPSLLPKYRGSTPIESAVIHGDKKTGVSIMQLAAEMDAGPVFAQTEIPLTGTETKFEVYDQLSRKGAELLLGILPDILDGELRATPQNESAASYCSLLEKSDALLDATALTATEAERKVRAHLEFPKTKIKLADKDIVITKAHVVEAKENILDIVCNEDTYLRIDELIGPSGRKMDGKSFLNGYAAG